MLTLIENIIIIFKLFYVPGTYWYDCPSKGGELYIAGFSGSILCPNATEFCRTEEITLLFNPATSLIMEWIVLGLMILVRVS